MIANPRLLSDRGLMFPPVRQDRAWSYDQAFSRNIGWVTRDEQARLRSKRIAIAGLGGVGGQHLLTLTRLGVGGFQIADFDTFDTVNFNRQAGAMVTTLGRPKVEVMANLARDINPELEIESFHNGVTPDNVDAFLDGADLYVDSVDFFAIEARRLLFARCAERAIPAITAAPLGMGVSFLAFLPGAMTFEQYFQLDGHEETEQLLRFMVGLAPAGLHRRYLADPTTISLREHRGPSTSIGIELCAGFAAAQALKILLARGGVPAAPTVLQFDAYRNRFVRSHRRGGNRHPLQRLMLWLGRRQLRAHAGR